MRVNGDSCIILSVQDVIQSWNEDGRGSKVKEGDAP